ncbi:MFS transporter [Micromonospora sp. NPDC050397]|uniref:MFS transporter n=1 Tax=Micromonospora sp. NPDC050397 TaxID=3364279 RepID=UPI00384D1451
MYIETSDVATSPDISRDSGRSRRWLTLAVIGLAQLLLVLDATIVSIALPTAQADLHITDTDRQWLLTAYTLTFGGFLLLGGRIADFTGRRRALIVGLIGFAAASALGGLATNAITLFAARALQGAFGALMAPAALALLSVTFTEAKERARAFGIWGAILGGGSALGLLLGGILTQYASWRWTLLIGTPIAIVAAIAAGRLIPESRAEGNTRYDLPGALTSTAGLVALVYGFTRAGEDGWLSPVTIGWLAGAVLLLVAFVAVESRSAHPLLPMRVILDRNRAGAYVAALLIGAGTLGVFLFLALYMQLTLGYSALMTGVAFLPFTVFIAAGATFATQMQSRVGPRFLISGGLLVTAVGIALLTLLRVASGFWTHVLPAQLVISFGMGVTFALMSNMALVGVGNHDAGVASALVNTSQQIGASLGTALLSTIFTAAVTRYLTDHGGEATDADQMRELQGVATVHGYGVTFWVGAAVTALAAGIVLLLVRAGREDISASEAPPAL